MAESQYEVPPRAVPANDAGYFEKITQAVFQAGFSWQVIRQKWPGFQKAFAAFDIDTVAEFTEEDLERLAEDKDIVRNGRKIAATRHNARVCRELIAAHGSLANYLHSLPGQSEEVADYNERAKQFSKKFKFMGPMGAYFFFWSVGEPVPEYHLWRASQES